MNDFVPLQNALKHNRFKEVVSGVLSAFENQPLNSAEIIQLGELALDAIERDPSNRKYLRLVLRKLANAYFERSSHAKAKEVYRELYLQDRQWSDLEGLLVSLAQSGEIEELRLQVKEVLPRLCRLKQTPKLRKIIEILNLIGALSPLVKEIEFKIAIFEGDFEKALASEEYHRELTSEFIRDSNWETSTDKCGGTATLSLDLGIIDKRLFIRKIYDAFMIHGPQSNLLLALLKYYVQTKSQHIGYFFNQNPGVKVELPSEKWIDKVLLEVARLEKPEEIEVELDLGEDLFLMRENASSTFRQIKSLESKIKFLLKHGDHDQAQKFIQELLRLDPSNKKFNTSNLNKSSNQEVLISEQDRWKSAWSTLEEIEGYAIEKMKLKEGELKFAWRQIEESDLTKNYREVAYALIQHGQEHDCIEMLDKIIASNNENFKDASYLKARCFLNLEKYKEAHAVAESVLESCVLDQEELCEFQYLRAICLELSGERTKALTIYKAVQEINSKYRLVRVKIDMLERE